jgi:hypothetical protein
MKPGKTRPSFSKTIPGDISLKRKTIPDVGNISRKSKTIPGDRSEK